MYHSIAHDPLAQRVTTAYLDIPRLRYRRILIPAMAYLLAGGHDALVDTAYRSVTLLLLALGACWLACLAQASGKSAVWGLAFCILPASIASIDRMAVDVGLLCFCCGFALYTRYIDNSRALYATLLAAGLVRDTGLLLVAAYCVWLLLRHEARKCAVFATAAVPTLAWYLFMSRRTPPDTGYGAPAIPFSGVLHRLTHPMDYVGSSSSVGMIRAMDFLAAAGVLLAMILAFRVLRRGRPDPVQLAIVLFALVGIFIWQPGDWKEALDYGRTLSPLLFFGALDYLRGARILDLVPLCMVLPRFGVQMGPQFIGVVKGLL